MRYLRIFILCLLSTLYLVLFSGVVYAQNEFSVDAIVTYDVQSTGKTIVTHNITLENNFSTLYATSYSLNLENIDAQNVRATEYINGKSENLEAKVKKDGDKTSIEIAFPDAVVGKDAKRNFNVSYENGSFATRTGEIWEVSVPKLIDNSAFRSYKALLKIPADFGLEAYISPKPEKLDNENGVRVYTFSQKVISQTGITAGFGQFQVFSFNLSYHLENPLSKSAKTQIAVPPDTAFQKVYLQKISPKPTDIVLDKDGNWLAVYNLSPHQRIDVSVSGSVQIFASYRPFPKPTDQEITDNLKESEYWQTNDPKIKALAESLKTPRDIYNYVSTNLKYKFDRVQPNVQRMGAVNALDNPTDAICMEYTDLFIAIARAAGIPAREINGYAYTENPLLQPLSLVADVLHAWPEYYDKEKGVWIPVDPTWASTSGGVDYFDKLDLRHFTFVIHGQSSTQPYPPGSYKLGPNPQKDVFVSFGKLPDNRVTNPLISISAVRTLPFLNNLYLAKIENPGPQALYSIYPTVFYDSKQANRDYIEVLPPFSHYQMPISVPFSLLGKDTPSIVEVKVGLSTAKIATNKSQIIINSLLIIFLVLILVIILILIRLKKISFKKLSAKIADIIQKTHAGRTNKPYQGKNNP